MADALRCKCAALPGWGAGNNSTWSLKRVMNRGMKAVCWELSIILAIRSVAFSRGKYNLLLPLLASWGKYMELSKGGILAFSGR